MNKKLGEDAFAFYAGLGVGRSYERVAQEFGTSRRTVTKAAKRENWPERVLDIDRQARARLEQNAVESLESMNERHLKVAKYIQSKALDTLKSLPLNSAMNAVRALNLAIEIERLTRGEPTDRTAVSVEEIVKREYARWLAPSDEGTKEHGTGAAGKSLAVVAAGLEQPTNTTS